MFLIGLCPNCGQLQLISNACKKAPAEAGTMIGQALVLVVITTYNQHVRLLSSEPFGWLTPPKSTRAWEPTLLWNHYTSNQVVAVNRSLLQQSTTIGKFVLYRGKVLRVKKLFVRTVPPLVAALCAWAQPSNSPA